MSKISEAISKDSTQPTNAKSRYKSNSSWFNELPTTSKHPPLDNQPIIEMVSHPAHYSMSDNMYEPYKVITAWDCDFNIGSAIKYLARYKKKWNPIEDLRKAKQYIDFEIEKLTNENCNEGKDDEKKF